MKRKRLYIGILIIAILAILTCVFVPGVSRRIVSQAKGTKAVAAHYDLINSVDASAIRQVMTDNPSTSRTIMWQSAYSEDDAVVEYRLKDSEEAMQVEATNEHFTDDGETYIHSATIERLNSNQTYEYRVGAGDKRSDWQVLSTADSADFKALIFPDSQSSDYSVWAQTALPAWQRNQDARFFINMGDLVDNGQDSYQWNAWFEVVEPMITQVPVAPVMGNHETYDKNWKVRMPEAYLHLFSLPSNGNTSYQNQWYSFDEGDVHFVVLNTQVNEMAEFQSDMDAEQIAWFKEDMAKTTKKWKVVLMHKDPFQYAFSDTENRPPRAEGFSPEGETWMPLFDEYGVDVVLSAHLHTYRNRGHVKDFQRNASGPLYIITGVAGNVRYPNLWKQHALDEYVAPQPETDNYMTMEVKGNSMTFQSFLPDGELLDTVSVTK